MNQDDLFNLFNGLAAVERAWLQHHRRDSFEAGPGKKHRGFGFVVFKDESALDQLLGKHYFSKFMRLPSGRTLEVKRALSSNDILEIEGGSGDEPSQQLRREALQEEQPSLPPQTCAFVVPLAGPGLWPIVPFLAAPPGTATVAPAASAEAATAVATACEAATSTAAAGLAETSSLMIPPPALLMAIPLLALGASLARRSGGLLAACECGGSSPPDGPCSEEQARATEAERRSLEALLLQAMPDHYEE
jgi:hypothetical protein